MMTKYQYEKEFKKTLLKFQLLFDLFYIVTDDVYELDISRMDLARITSRDILIYNRCKTLEKVLGKEK